MSKTHGSVSFGYALLIYNEMDRIAIETQSHELSIYGYPAEHGLKVKVFTGLISTCAASVGVSVSNTSHATNLLTAMQCITKLRGGGLRHQSVYILHYTPTEEDFKRYRESLGMVNRRITPSKYDMLINDFERTRQELKDLQARVAKLEALQSGRYNI